MIDRLLNFAWPALAVLIVCNFVLTMVYAQSALPNTTNILGVPLNERVGVNETRVSNLDERVKEIEKLELDHRLTTIETKLTTGNYLNYTSTGGLLLLVLEAYKRRRTRPSDSERREHNHHD